METKILTTTDKVKNMNTDDIKSLIQKMEKVTKVTNKHADRYILLEFINYGDINSIIFTNKDINNIELVSLLSDLYDWIFPEIKDMEYRIICYEKLRKAMSLKENETILTIASYLYSNGITNEKELINYILLILSKNLKYVR